MKLCDKGHEQICYEWEECEECPLCVEKAKTDKLRCEVDKLFIEICEVKTQRDILLQKLKEVQGAKGL